VPPKRSDRETKDVWLTVPIEPRHESLVKTAADRQGRAVAAYVRYLILTDMQRQGLVDIDFNPIPQNPVLEPADADQ
jgi:hypothetical protein